MNLHPRKKGTRGFSIIEAMIALVLLTFAVMSLFGVVSATFDYTQQDSEHMQAVAAAQQYLDAIRQAKQNGNALPAAPTVGVDLGYGLTGAQITSLQNFSMTNNACPQVTGSQLLFNCQVTASWTQSGATKSLIVQSYVAQQ